MSALRNSLERATQDDEPLARADFFKIFLESNLYLPVKPGEHPDDGIALIGENSLELLHVATVRQAGVEVVPAFTDAEFVQAWAGKEWPTRVYPAASLLQVMKADTWLHLNPNQEHGKEFTPWEIAILRGGVEAIPELVAEHAPQLGIEVEIDTDSSVFAELKSRLRSVLEAYEEIDEGFLISFRQDDAPEPSPVIGLKQKGMTEERVAKFRDEVMLYGTELLSPYQEIAVVEDLSDRSNHLAELFEGATPFYYRGHLPTNDDPSIFQQLYAFIGGGKTK